MEEIRQIVKGNIVLEISDRDTNPSTVRYVILCNTGVCFSKPSLKPPLAIVIAYPSHVQFYVSRSTRTLSEQYFIFFSRARWPRRSEAKPIAQPATEWHYFLTKTNMYLIFHQYDVHVCICHCVSVRYGFIRLYQHEYPNLVPSL